MATLARLIGLGSVAAAVLAGPGLLARVGDAPAGPPLSLQAKLDALRTTARLPAVAAAMFTSDGITSRAVAGVRREGDATAATIDDRWHIGSVTKTFTSLLIARRVEQGVWRWDSTLGEILGAVRAGGRAGVTLRHLLSHRSGLPANVPASDALKFVTSPLALEEQRRQVRAGVLAGAPSTAPGTSFLYSNLGFIVLGSLLEEQAGRPWEQLVREEILEPLGLATAGFGAPGGAGTLTEPRGHRAAPGGALVAVEPGLGADNLPFLGPAGTLHMSLMDLARWGQSHLRGERGIDGLVRAETFRALHAPLDGADYALGWAVRRTPAGTVVWHNGSNTLWYATVGFDSAADRGVAIMTNGSIAAQRAIDAAFGELIRSEK